MKKISRGTILKILVTLALVSFLIYQLDLGALVSVLLSTRLEILCLAIALQAGLVMLTVIRWRTVLRDFQIRAPFLFLARIAWMGNFFSLFLPSSIGGDVLRAYFLARAKAQSMATTLTTTVLERSGGLGALLIIGLAAVSVKRIDLQGVSLLNVFIVLIAAYALANALLFNSRFHRLLSRLLQRIKRADLDNKLAMVYQGLHTLVRNYRSVAQVMFLSLLIQFFSTMIVWLAALSLSIDAPVHVFLAFVPLINLSIMVPLTINGFGLRESLYLLLFAEIGLQDEQAVALSLLNTLVIMVTALPGGALYSMYKRTQDVRIAEPAVEYEET